MSSSPDLPFVAAPPGTVGSVTRSAQRAAEHWHFAAPELLRMGMNGIFTVGEGVLLRVSSPTAPPQQAVWLANLLSGLGLRVPVHVRDEPFMTEDHAVFAVAEVVERGPIDWRAVGEMVARLHLIAPDTIANGYPLPFCGDFPWWNFSELMGDVGSELDPRSRRSIEVAIEGGLPVVVDQRGGESVVCHGDVHPGNVLQSEDGPVLLDWDLVCRGPAAWDHAPLMTWTQRWGGQAGIYEAFADGYGRSFVADPVAEAIAELRLVAATLMRVRAGRTNPAAAAEAELRLRYWRGEADAPQWHAQ
ncbi:MAG: phosphotransferase enzyme family protein [Ilumatobacteraceae bacterium]